MRIYSVNGTEETKRLIKYAEEVSLGRCEECGTTEDVTTEVRGWIRTLCQSCRGRRQLGVNPTNTNEGAAE